MPKQMGFHAHATGRAGHGPRKRGKLVVAAGGLLGLAAGLLLPAVAVSADGPTIEATSGGGGFAWNPATAAVGPGGAVNFKSNSTVVEHGVTWTGGPGTPSCTGVPINEGRTSWSGSCTFASPGNYAFVCSVHPIEMKGTITVGSGETNPPPPGSSTTGPVAKDLKIAKSQRGGVVRGSIQVLAGAGGKLEVELLGARAVLLGPGKAGKMRVGRTVRSSLPSGRVQFSVSLKPVARRALRLKKRLSLTVRIVVTAPGRPALTLKRGVVLHG
jgi:plastocyanin